jgi:hypothetical protein
LIALPPSIRNDHTPIQRKDNMNRTSNERFKSSQKHDRSFITHYRKLHTMTTATISLQPDRPSIPSRPPLRMSVHQLADSHSHTARVSIHIKPLRLDDRDTSDYAHIAITPAEVVKLFLRPRAPEKVAADPCTAWAACCAARGVAA